MPVERSRDRLRMVAVVLVALGYAAPLAATRFFPGLDVPWHAAVVEVLRARPGQFLGYFATGSHFSSNVTLYYGVLALARVTGDVAVAMQLVCALYVVGFVLSARSLLRAFGVDGVLALLAAPAAYSQVMEFGFVGYALCLPLTLWLWALVRRLGDGGAGAPARLAGIAALSALIAFTHPFAAAVALAGVITVALTQLTPETRRRMLASCAVALVGMVPAALAVALLAGDNSAASTPGVWQGASLLTRLTSQAFVSPIESVATAPVRLFGYVPDGWRFLLVVLGLAVAALLRHRAGPPAAASAARGRTAGWLLAVIAALYLITPYTFDWPRQWYGAQPRLLPLLWVLGLVAVGPRAGRLGRRALALPAVVSAAALALLWLTAFAPFAREAADFRAVIQQSAPQVRTLALIEQRPAPWREPPSPWRHAGAWLLVEKDGFVSNLPFATPVAGNAGMIVPVQLASGAPPIPRSPLLGQAAQLQPSRDLPGWDQVLIRDRDPAEPRDYHLDGYRDQFRLVAHRGRWRLYRRR